MTTAHPTRPAITAEVLVEACKELDQRRLEEGMLTLYWYPGSPEVWLVIAPEHSRFYSLLNLDGAQASEAFRHPFAYDGWVLMTYA
jgi:hypothetical protein